METRILESSINKICSLLAVGFGDAGAEVLTCNLKLSAIPACERTPCQHALSAARHPASEENNELCVRR